MKVNPDNIQKSIFLPKSSFYNDQRKLVNMHPYKPELGRYLTGSVDIDTTQRFMAFCPSCAGKNSHQQSVKLDELISFLSDNVGEEDTPFGLFLRSGVDGLTEAIKATKLGKWSLLAPSLYETARFYEEHGFGEPNWSPTQYTALPGWGLKTARLFQMHVFHEPCAVLDTYILKWLAGHKRFHGTDIHPPMNYKDVPTQSISKWETYQRWEDAFLAECVRRNLSPLELDKAIWVHARIKPKQEQVTRELELV